MTILNKEGTLFERDEDGKFIPQKVKLELSNEDVEIKIIPMTRAAIRKLILESTNDNGEVVTTRDQDGEIILKYCLEPKYTEDDVKAMKTYYSIAITTAILLASGISEPRKDISIEEKELKKN